MTVRVGVGFDAHPFAPGCPLRLGGVEIPYAQGLKGHSDGDAMLHAIADALLGAAGAGSLGEHFPDDDAAWRGADSGVFCTKALERVREAGFTVGNLDAVILAEEPKIAPHRSRIRDRIAALLEVESHRVNVRGTSSNGLGFTGRGEGIAAIAVVLLEPGSGKGKTSES